MNTHHDKTYAGELLDSDMEFTLVEVCQVCRISVDQLTALVDQGIIEPVGREPAQWRFKWIYLQRISRARRLQRDLGLNDAGVGLALELLDEIYRLRRRLHLPLD